MRVFVTGATSFVGAVAVQELLGAGHQVLALACSEVVGRMLGAVGAEVHQGDLLNRDSWRRGVEAADAVLHLACSPGAATEEATGVANARVIKSFGAMLAGSNRPLVVTSVLGSGVAGRLVEEDDWLPPDSPPPWGATEQAAAAVAEAGVRVSVVRLPLAVYGEGEGTFLAALLQLARATGVAAYPQGSGSYWPAVHRRDAARLFRLVLEHAPALGTRWHAVAEAGVATRAVAEAIGRRLRLPVVSQSAETAAAHFGELAPFAGPELPATSQYLRQLGWWPQQPGLLASLTGDTGGAR